MNFKTLAEAGIKLSPSLHLTLPKGGVSLTPTTGLALAEALLRRSARKALDEEIQRVPKKRVAR